MKRTQIFLFSCLIKCSVLHDGGCSTRWRLFASRFDGFFLCASQIFMCFGDTQVGWVFRYQQFPLTRSIIPRLGPLEQRKIADEHSKILDSPQNSMALSLRFFAGDHSNNADDRCSCGVYTTAFQM